MRPLNPCPPSPPRGAASSSRRFFPALLALLLALVATPAPLAAPGSPSEGVLAVDYRGALDLRAPSRTGEALGRLVARAEANPEALTEAERAALVEASASLARLLPAALPPREGAAPLVELAKLYPAGAGEPAFAGLLRAGRLVVESDGRGKMRALLPEPSLLRAPGEAPPAPATANERALERAWPVLRHVLAAERRRLAKAGGEAPPLALEVHAFAHEPLLQRFLLVAEPLEREVSDTRSRGQRPPLDAAALRAFFDAGLWLEGARIEPEGGLQLLGSERAERPTMLGQPLTLSDLAVAWRAVAHGGPSSPFMSLDLSHRPWKSVVRHGGLLDDTRLGFVTLLADIRFKTLSQGIDPWSGEDDRPRIREKIPGFRTHAEQMAYAGQAEGAQDALTRFWFYPDAVDLTLSPEGDVMVLRRARMAAGSERVDGQAQGSALPPWTASLITSINEEYDALAALYPELADLDQVVRLLALATWLRRAEEAGLPVPDMDALLAEPLPAAPTPESFPHLLAFTAFPAPGSMAPVAVHERSDIARALDRLEPGEGEVLLPRIRAERAAARLDPVKPPHAALASRIASALAEGADALTLDELSYAAERLHMHRLVLGTLPMDAREELIRRTRAGERLFPFSVGIGGLDLDMGSALDRAAVRGARLSLGGPGAPGAPGAADARRTMSAPAASPSSSASPGAPGMAPASPRGAAGPAARRPSAPAAQRGVAPAPLVAASGLPEVREAWRREGGGVAEPLLPEHAPASRGRVARAGRLIVERPAPGRVALRLEPGPRPAPPEMLGADALPEGAALARVRFDARGEGAAPAADGARLELRTPGGVGEAIPLAPGVLERAALGPRADLSPQTGLPGLVPAPSRLRGAAALLVAPPLGDDALLGGEARPESLARGLNAWWGSSADAPRAVVAATPAAARRWSAAPKPRRVELYTPESFPAHMAEHERALESAFAGEASRAGNAGGKTLLLVVSASPKARLERALLEEESRLKGRLVALVSLTDPLPEGLPERLLEAGAAGVATSERRPEGAAAAIEALAAWGAALGRAGGEERVERLEGPFVWFF